jgi:ubiquitin thioesterase OTU1
MYDMMIMRTQTYAVIICVQAACVSVQAHEARQFTDTANFTLRCGVCQLPVKGEKEAVEHAKATGHQRFGEY